jgi:hypothetical protein
MRPPSKINRIRLGLACFLLLIFSNVQAQLNFHPPRIVISNEPMELMLIDGPPASVPISGTQIEFVINTDWDVFHNKESGLWYILKEGYWLAGNFLSSGDWLNTVELPRDFMTLQVSSDWPSVAAAMPPRRPATKPLPITISYEPTELVLIDGDIKLEAIAGTSLQFVSNTRNDLFLLKDRYYILLSGRWFASKDFKRQWAPVKDLPADFAMIPEDHNMARVLASVPGTPQAEQAIAEAAKPRIARLSRDAGGDVKVPYVGEPSFVSIEATGLRRAENTPFQVIMHNNFYYLCYEGAWYSSTRPEGPWQVATEVPEEIYNIPPTDPAYNVTFVRVESFDDSSNEVAYKSTSGYYNRYYTGYTRTMVYGTGWYYPGYHNRYSYWRYPHTYGYGGYRGAHYYPYGYSHSETYRVNRQEKDWEWDLNGNKRQIYDYGPTNYVGSGTYQMPESDNYKGDGR